MSAGAPGLAHDVLDSVVADFRRPEFRAGFAVAVTSAIVLARCGVGRFPTVLASVMLGSAAERLAATTEQIAGHIAHLEIASMATDAPGEV